MYPLTGALPYGSTTLASAPLTAQLAGFGQQRNPWAGTVGHYAGSILGGAFGGPLGSIGGGIVGTNAGNAFGNMIGGRDAYNGSQGDFFDNFNPASRYGLMSVQQGPIPLLTGNNKGIGQLFSGGLLGGGMPMGGLLGGR